MIEGTYGTFLLTDLALDHSTSNQVLHDKNLIDSAIKNKVSHVVFSGSDNASQVINKPSIHFDNKVKIEQYDIKMSDKINFTSFRLPMFYEAIMGSTMKKVNTNEFILTIPMADKPVYCIINFFLIFNIYS